MVLANDTDPNSNTLTVTAVGTPTDGNASIGSGGGYVVYTPPGGTYTFGDMISDGAGGTASSAVTVYVDSLEGCCTTIVLYPHNQRLKAPAAGSLSLILLPRSILAVVGWRVLTEPSKSFKSARGEIVGSTAQGKGPVGELIRQNVDRGRPASEARSHAFVTSLRSAALPLNPGSTCSARFRSRTKLWLLGM